MKKITAIFVLFITSLTTLFGQCIEEDKTRVLLIGDSWANFLKEDGTFNTIFDHWGQSNYIFYSNDILAVNGAKIEDFLIPSRLLEVENQLNDFSDIKAVHISLGGNDFLGTWNVDFTPDEVETLSDETYNELLALIAHIRTVKPGVQIVFSGYMYSNFEEVIESVAPFQTSHPYYVMWQNMGYPNFEQLNVLLNDFSDRVENLADTDENMSFINVPALMQHIYGQIDPLSVDPGGSYAPFSQPLPNGDISYPSPMTSMRDYGIAVDCFHLSAEGYEYMIDYQFQKFYHKFFMDEFYTFASDLELNGTVFSDGSVTSDLNLGLTTVTTEAATIFSFNTVEMEDTIVENASIFVRRESQEGINPINSTVKLRMVNGCFGETTAIEMNDYADTGDIEEVACVFGLNTADGQWLRIDLPESFIPFLNNSASIQFMLLTDNEGVGQIFFTNGTDLEFAPVLNVNYKSSGFIAVNESKIASDFNVFPNPVTQELSIIHKSINDFKIDEIEIVNMQGQILKTILNKEISNVPIQISVTDLPTGNYFVKLKGENSVNVIQFIKK